MVLHKRLDYGFNGYQVPPTPRATRSVRKRRIVRSKSDGNQMCPFDLLATVAAGKLLLEGKDIFPNVKDSCSIKKEHSTGDKPSSAITSSASCKLERDDNSREMKTEPFNNGEMCGSDHIVKFPSCGSSSVNREDVKLSTRDGDENSRCTQPSTRNKAGYTRQRSLRDYPFKKRKLYYDYTSLSDLDQALNGVVTEPLTTSSAVERASFPSRDSEVKLKIKSFRVPELFIEIPETATIASLKRTVMKAVTAILGGGGVRVGVLLQGKKIRDDNKTLLQTGISHDNNNNPEALGFILEPNSSRASPTICSQPTPLKRYPMGPSVAQHETCDILLNPPASIISNLVESDHDSAPSPPDMSHEQNTVDSRALVVVPPSINAGPLSVVPVRKPKKSTESAQRRIRRPFSVSEVEALVQAVEKLGTGRWRDVKLRAFDTAKHRTYVDLKDKWKTLVHTARISPQQRRGEPVPQELLDRVLMAHAYWSQQQAKQQLKQHSEACFLL